jgi:hypothetical protein
VDENGRVVILVKKCDRVGLLEMSEWDDIWNDEGNSKGSKKRG